MICHGLQIFFLLPPAPPVQNQAHYKIYYKENAKTTDICHFQDSSYKDFPLSTLTIESPIVYYILDNKKNLQSRKGRRFLRGTTLIVVKQPLIRRNGVCR
jgi:hypothetical protein